MGVVVGRRDATTAVSVREGVSLLSAVPVAVTETTAMEDDSRAAAMDEMTSTMAAWEVTATLVVATEV